MFIGFHRVIWYVHSRALLSHFGYGQEQLNNHLVTKQRDLNSAFNPSKTLFFFPEPHATQPSSH